MRDQTAAGPEWLVVDRGTTVQGFTPLLAAGELPGWQHGICMSATRGKSWCFGHEAEPIGLGPKIVANKGPARQTFGAAERGDRLELVILFQDSLMRDWAMQLWGRVSAAIGPQIFSINTWRISDLTHPQVLPEASAKAIRADMILIAVREWAQPPLEISAWVENWVPHRPGRPGSMAALIAVPEQKLALVSSAQQFLASVAARAGLDFLPRQRALPQGRLDLLDSRHLAQRANTTTLILSDILNQEQQSSRARWRSP